MKTVTALYNTVEDARDVVAALTDAGFDRDNISIVANDADNRFQATDPDRARTDAHDVSAAEGAGAGALAGGVLGLLAGIGGLMIPGIGPVVAAGPLIGALTGATAGAVTGGLVAGLVDLGVPEERATYYAEGIRRGGTLVALETADERVDNAVAIMNRHNPVDMNRRVSRWREQGWKGYDADAAPYTAQQVTSERDDYARDLDRDADAADVTIPVIEEEVKIGKRQVSASTGGVRVLTHVVERPVTEEVRLRKERVDIDRRRVDRPVTEADLEALEEGTIEVTATVEQPVVSKEARVVEEIHIDKDVETETRTVRETARRTDIDVQRIGAQEHDDDFSAFEDDFRDHFKTTYRGGRYNYTQVQPAYQYGYDLANDPTFRGRSWPEIEPDARRRWERENQGTWGEFKESVRHAWREVKEAVN